MRVMILEIVGFGKKDKKISTMFRKEMSFNEFY